MAVFTTACKGYLTYRNLIIHLKYKLMKKVYIVFWTYDRDTEDYDSQPETSMVGIYSTEELAKQKIAYMENYTERAEEILSYEDYTAHLADVHNRISSDPELDYCNYLYTMRDTSSSSYHYEEYSVLEKLEE
jgi:hypothetical protein